MRVLNDALFTLALTLGLVLALLHRVLPTRVISLGSALVLAMLCVWQLSNGKTVPALVVGALALLIACGELVLHLLLRARQARDWGRR